MDEGGGEEAIAEVDPNQPQFKYEIIGTVEYSFRTPTEDILFLISESEPEKVKNELMKCGVIIFDITQNEGQIQKALDTLTSKNIKTPFWLLSFNFGSSDWRRIIQN